MSAAPARAADWNVIGTSGHGVQFYNDDRQLTDLLTRYVGSALVCGDAAIVIATPTHRELLAQRLSRRGLDVRVPAAQGRYFALDAAETLSAFCAGDVIDEPRFRKAAGDLLSRASSASGRPSRVAAFGEVVALLWASGRAEAAIRLEELWNEIAANRTFSMCCAYPMDIFNDSEAARFLKVCAQHSCVFPAGARTESSWTPFEADLRAPVSS